MKGMRLGRWWLMTAVAVVAACLEYAHGTDTSSTLECHKRMYTYRVTQSDSQGRICWDDINVMSCWGRCDSNEISDWRFPYKRSYHPVCMHGGREARTVTLNHCEQGVEEGTERYTYLHATTCRCHVCRSSEASCQGVRTTQEKGLEEAEPWGSLLYLGDES